MRLIALPAGPHPVTPPAEAPAPTQSRPYLVFSPEYGQTTDPDVPPWFTNNSLKILYSPPNGGERSGIAENIHAVPLTRIAADFIWPEDIGAPSTQRGPVFVDSSENTVSILKQGEPQRSRWCCGRWCGRKLAARRSGRFARARPLSRRCKLCSRDVFDEGDSC